MVAGVSSHPPFQQQGASHGAPARVLQRAKTEPAATLHTLGHDAATQPGGRGRAARDVPHQQAGLQQPSQGQGVRVGASRDGQAAPPPPLTERVLPDSILLEQLPQGNDMRLTYRDRDGNNCGPFIVTIRPMPSVQQLALAQESLVNLIDLAFSADPDCSHASFQASNGQSQPALATLTLHNSDDQSTRKLLLGGGANLAVSEPDEHRLAPDDAPDRRYADLIDRNMRHLKRMLREQNGSALSFSVRRASPAAG